MRAQRERNIIFSRREYSLSYDRKNILSTKGYTKKRKDIETKTKQMLFFY